MKIRTLVAGSAAAAALAAGFALPAQAAPKDIDATVTVLVDADGPAGPAVAVPVTVVLDDVSPGQAKNLTGEKNAKRFAQADGPVDVVVTNAAYANADAEIQALIAAELVELGYVIPPATFEVEAAPVVKVRF
jgi:hypothetical protein